MKTHETIELRMKVQALLGIGLTPSEIGRELGCSRTTVYKVIDLLESDSITDDKRRNNPGRAAQFDAHIWEVIRKVRLEDPTLGPIMIHHLLKRSENAQLYGIQPEDVPSPASIALKIREWGLANKPVGPKSKRTFPDPRPTAPGVLTIDAWGPWHIRASRLYLVTIQDRYTRASVGIPIVTSTAGAKGSGISAEGWLKAISVAYRYLLNGVSPNRLYADNGIGLAPAGTNLSRASRLALSLGASCTFIPPAEPWRNGRLERFHWTLEREYFRKEDPRTVKQALDGFTEYLNWYNHHRPHSSLRYKAPGEVFPVQVLPNEFWEEPAEEGKEWQGHVTAIRLVQNTGYVELWNNERVLTASILAGQYVRVEFEVNSALPYPQPGRIVYNRKKEEAILVGLFTHRLGESNKINTVRVIEGGRIRLVDFDNEVKGNELIDDMQYQNMVDRILKRRRRPTNDEEREGAVDKVPLAGDGAG